MPALADRPCRLYVLPPNPTQADLDLGFATRGADLLSCDAARRLAVQTFVAEHQLQDQRVKAAKPKRRWLGFPL